jgi:hypothetical protein
MSNEQFYQWFGDNSLIGQFVQKLTNQTFL